MALKKYLISIKPAGSLRLSKLFMQSTFSRYKDQFSVMGIVGKDLSVSEYFSLAVAGKAKALTPAELGCCLSHLAALKDFVASEEQYAIIFEDDVIQRFDVDLEALEVEISALSLQPCLLFSLGGIQMKICNRVKGRVLNTKLLQQKILKVDLDFLLHIFSAYAYVVDQSMAQLLLKLHQSPRVFDHWSELLTQQQAFSYYATFLFEHPEVKAEEDSYLEAERRININTYSKNRFEKSGYFKRKIKKLILNGVRDLN